MKTAILKSYSKEQFIGILLSVIFFILGFFINYIINFFIARHLSPAAYGNVGVALCLLSALSMMVLFGLDQSAMKFIPDYIGQEQWALMRGFIAMGLRVIFYTSIPFLLVTIIIMIFSFNGYYVQLIKLRHPIVFFLWAVPICACLTFFIGILAGMYKQVLSVFLQACFLPLLQLISLFILFYFFHELTEKLSILSFTFAVLVLLMITFLLFKKNLPRTFFQVKSIRDKTEWMGFTRRIFITHFIGFHVGTVIVLALRFINSDENLVGYYCALQTIIGFYWLIFIAVTSFLTPLIAAAWNRQAEEKFQAVINKMMFTIMGGGLIVLIVFFCFGEIFLAHFGEIYKHLYWELQVFSAATFVSQYRAILTVILNYTNQEEKAMHSAIWNYLLFVILIIISAKYGNLLDTAILFLISQLIFASWQVYLVKRYSSQVQLIP